MGATVESSAQTYRVIQKGETGSFSLSAQQDVEGWGMILLPIPIGLLALGFVLALGGIFAIAGPWMVFAVAHLIRQRWARKAAEQLWQKARELVEAHRDKATSIHADRFGGNIDTFSTDNKSMTPWLPDNLLSQPAVVA